MYRKVVFDKPNIIVQNSASTRTADTLKRFTIK